MGQIMHGTMLPARERFFLWAEGMSGTEDAPKRRGRQPKIQSQMQLQILAHPFAAPQDWMAACILNTDSHLEPWPVTMTSWLPSTAKMPQPSPELQAEGFSAPDSAATPLALKAWSVAGIEMSVSDTLDFLLAL